MLNFNQSPTSFRKFQIILVVLNKSSCTEAMFKYFSGQNGKFTYFTTWNFESRTLDQFSFKITLISIFLRIMNILSNINLIRWQEGWQITRKSTCHLISQPPWACQSHHQELLEQLEAKFLEDPFRGLTVLQDGQLGGTRGGGINSIFLGKGHCLYIPLLVK